MAKYNIGGYIFNDETSAKKAAKELKAVEYILGQIKTADEEGVLKVYKKLINQRIFSTEIGMSFLSQLRQNLLASEVFSESDVPPIYSLDESKPDTSVIPEKADERKISEKVEKVEKTEKSVAKEDKGSQKKQTKLKKQKAEKSKSESKDSDIVEVKRLRLINKLLLLAVFTLLLIVGGMFYVSSTINSPTILNYKETITDEYASWKEQLDAREKDLDEREAELLKREAGQ